MSITVREIIDNPLLKSTAIAGVEGLAREITWAHSCELNDPSPWLTGGELIMTSGIAIPISEKDQILYLNRLIHAGASGLAVGKELHAPELTEEFLRAADKNAFPILLTDYDVPWIAISKTVVLANSTQNYTQVDQTLRLYDILRKSINRSPPKKIIELLSKIVNCQLYILDSKNGRLLFNEDKNFNEKHEIKPGDQLLSNNHNNNNKKITAQLAIPSSRPAILYAVSNSTTPPDTIILRHISTILGLIVEKESSVLERQRRVGTEIFRELIEGKVTDEIASILLKDYRLGSEPLCIISCKAIETNFEEERLHYYLIDCNIPHLIAFRENNIFILVPKHDHIITNLRAELPETIYIGISNSIIRLTKIPDAYQEAIWALHSAESNNINMVDYAKSFFVSPFLPRNMLKAEDSVKQVLGNLLEYDDKHSAELTKTLYIYLSENRSWKKTAAKLHIHKQTLVYRINRIEEISGYRLDNINSISELWLALQAARMLNLIPDFINSN